MANIFPIVKDAAVQQVSAGETWNGLTSRIKCLGSFTLSAPSGVDVAPGTVVVVANDGSGGAATVTLSPNPFPGANMNAFAIPDNDYGSFMYVDATIGFLPLGTGDATVA